MAPPNATWRDITAQASQNAEVLRQPEVVRNVHTILSTNVSVCQSLGHPFIHQMQHIYMDMLHIYRCAACCRLVCVRVRVRVCVCVWGGGGGGSVFVLPCLLG